MSPKLPSKQSDRKVIYPSITVQICQGKDALTAKQAKELLKWEEETIKVKFGGDYLLKDSRNHKVRCYNNVTNRPFRPNIAATLKQEHLRKRWELNCETIIIGRTGLILDGQHSLIALILAVQEWNDQPDKWSDYWKHEPTMEKLVAFGADESDKVVNTINTGKSRTLGDVLYRSEYFADLSSKDRKVVARMTSHAIRLLWHRTGADLNAFAPRRTHAESLDFIERHSRLLECVKYIYEQDADSAISRYIGSGYASALLYLMGSAATDSQSYHEADVRDEEWLDWATLDKAREFWNWVASNEEENKPLRTALGKIIDDGGGSLNERCALGIKAWLCFLDETPITEEAIKLTYHTDDQEIRTLAECPTTGGIDLGDPTTDDSRDSKPTTVDPSPEQIRERAKAERRKRSLPK